MKNLKLFFILTLALLITDKIGAVTYVSEIVNNTNGCLKLEYSVPIAGLTY